MLEAKSEGQNRLGSDAQLLSNESEHLEFPMYRSFDQVTDREFQW